MKKSELIKKLERYSDDEEVTVLLNNHSRKPYIVDLVEVTSTRDVDGGIEILLVPDLD